MVPAFYFMLAASVLCPGVAAAGTARADAVPAAQQSPAPTASAAVAPLSMPDTPLEPAAATPRAQSAADAEAAAPRPIAALAAPSAEAASVTANEEGRGGTPSARASDEHSGAAVGEDEAALAGVPFDQTPPRRYGTDDIILPNAGKAAPPAKGAMRRLLDRWLGRREPAAPIARGPIDGKAELAARLEPLLPWRTMDSRRDRKLPNYGEARRWRAYLDALRRPVPPAERVVVFRVTEPDTLMETGSGLATLSYFLVKERKGRAMTADLVAAARDIWARLDGTTNSIGLHTVDDPLHQWGMLRSSPWISTTTSVKGAPTFRPNPDNRVEVLALDPRMLFASSSWDGENEKLTPFAIWPEDLVAAVPAKDFSPQAVRIALRQRFGPQAEALIGKTDGLR